MRENIIYKCTECGEENYIKSTNTVQDVIKKLYIKKRNKPYWLFFFIGGRR